MTNLNIAALSLITFGFLGATYAQSEDRLHLALSQGISSPNVTSPVNLSHGFVPTNPAVAGTLGKIHVTAEYGTTETSNQSGGTTGNSRRSSTGGVELGAGSGSVGIAAGYLKSDCDTCQGRGAAMVGASFDSLALGVGFYEKSTYSLGLLLNPKGPHRVGVTGSFFDSDQVGDDLTAYGLGYSYHSSSVVLAVDASKRKRETASASDDVILVTPGVQVKVDWLALSVSHDVYLNDQTNSTDRGTWFGIGINATDMHFAIYHDYFHEWAVTATFFF